MARTCPKTDFGAIISKIQLRNWNQLFQDTMCAYFQAKLASLTLLRVNILEKPCVTMTDKRETLHFFGPSLPKNEFWGLNFKSLSQDLESAPPIYHVYRVSVKTDKFEFFGLNLGKLPNYVRYFGSNNIEGVAESWVEN